jgi:hypothetical protein
MIGFFMAADTSLFSLANRAGAAQRVFSPFSGYTASHKNIPQKGRRHPGCSQKALRHRNVFCTTTISAKILEA